MGTYKKVTLGARVDIYTDAGAPYITKVEDITEDGKIVISPPIDKFSTLRFKLGQKLKLCYYIVENRSMITYTNRFSLEAEVVKITQTSTVELITLNQLTEPVKEQRRESFRLNINRDVITRPFKAGPFPYRPDEASVEEERTRTENISETGALIRTKNTYEKGDKLYIKLFLCFPLPESDPMEFACEIMQTVNIPNEPKRIGLKFVDTTVLERDTLAKFILVEQQKTLKRNKWLRK